MRRLVAVFTASVDASIDSRTLSTVKGLVQSEPVRWHSEYKKSKSCFSLPIKMAGSKFSTPFRLCLGSVPTLFRPSSGLRSDTVPTLFRLRLLYTLSAVVAIDSAVGGDSKTFRLLTRLPFGVWSNGLCLSDIHSLTCQHLAPKRLKCFVIVVCQRTCWRIFKDGFPKGEGFLASRSPSNRCWENILWILI